MENVVVFKSSDGEYTHISYIPYDGTRIYLCSEISSIFGSKTHHFFRTLNKSQRYYVRFFEDGELMDIHHGVDPGHTRISVDHSDLIYILVHNHSIARTNFRKENLERLLETIRASFGCNFPSETTEVEKQKEPETTSQDLFEIVRESLNKEIENQVSDNFRKMADSLGKQFLKITDSLKERMTTLERRFIPANFDSLIQSDKPLDNIKRIVNKYAELKGIKYEAAWTSFHCYFMSKTGHNPFDLKIEYMTKSIIEAVEKAGHIYAYEHWAMNLYRERI